MFKIKFRNFFLVFVVILTFMAPMIEAVSVDEARLGLVDAFVALSKAELVGGDVHVLAFRLNSAAALIDQGGEENLVLADQIIKEVASEAAEIEVTSAQRSQFRYVIVGVTLVVLAVIGLVIWFRGSKVFWVVWLRLKKGWRIEQL